MKKKQRKSWIKSRTAINVTRSRPGPRNKKKEGRGRWMTSFIYSGKILLIFESGPGETAGDVPGLLVRDGKKIAPVRAMDKSGYPDTKPGSGQARRHRRIFKVRVRELFPEK